VRAAEPADIGDTDISYANRTRTLTPSRSWSLVCWHRYARGHRAPGRGKFVFGDIVRGRLFAADLAAMKKADDGIPQTVAPVEEIQLYVRGAGGSRVYVTLRELTEQTMGATIARADLHISRSGDGELFITSRRDGVIRMLVPD